MVRTFTMDRLPFLAALMHGDVKLFPLPASEKCSLASS